MKQKYKQKQKRKQQNAIGMTKWISEITEIYVFVILLVYPVFYNNNFIDIVRSKLAFFKVVTFIYVAIASVCMVAEWLEKRKKGIVFEKPASFSEALRKIPKDYLFVGIFIAAIFLSTLLSDYRAESFLGSQGRRLGAMVMLLYLFIYLVPGKYLNFRRPLLWAFLISNTLIILLGIQHFWGVDILHMYDNLAGHQHAMFISTIGNINVNAGYLCLILPAVMVLFWICEEKKMKIIYGIFLVLGFYEGFSTISDSFFLGIGVAFLVLFWFSCKEHQKMLRFLEVYALFFVSCFLMQVTYLIGLWSGCDSVFFTVYQTLGVPQLITSWPALAAEAVLLAGLYFLIYKAYKHGKSFPYLMIRRVLYILLAVLFAAAVVIVIVANCKAEDAWTGSLAVLNRLQLRDSFGNNRGYIWKRAMITYKEFPWYQKLFGYGLNCFGQSVNEVYGEEMVRLYEGVFIDAHNEFIQFLVTTGIVGVIGYFGIFFSSVVYYGKRAAKSPILVMGIASLLGYLSQAMVNNPQTFITPSVFLFLGIVKCLSRKYEQQEEQHGAKCQ